MAMTKQDLDRIFRSDHDLPELLVRDIDSLAGHERDCHALVRGRHGVRRSASVVRYLVRHHGAGRNRARSRNRSWSGLRDRFWCGRLFARCLGRVPLRGRPCARGRNCPVREAKVKKRSGYSEDSTCGKEVFHGGSIDPRTVSQLWLRKV